jgi:Domain of unknown function (DUF1707)
VFSPARRHDEFDPQGIREPRSAALVEFTRDDAADAAHPMTEQGVRASDAERAAAADRVHTALVEGRLDVGEAEERLAAVYAARHRSDLPVLLADLPVPAAGQPDGGWAAVWRAIVEQAWLSSARARGALPERPDQRQRRAAAVVLIAATVWVTVCVLAGIAVGVHS